MNRTAPPSHTDFQQPPFFVPDSVSPDRKTIQIIDDAGDVHDLSIDVALIAIEACKAVGQLGHLEINTPEFERGSLEFEMGSAR